MRPKTTHTLLRAILALVAMLAVFALPGCKGKEQAGTGKKGLASGRGLEESLNSDKAPDYPVLWDTRPYKNIHKSAQQAWFLTETAYFVVQDKWRSATGEQRKAVEQEIDRNVFGVNDEVKQLFEDAIKAEPDNALNYASYAMWLKPRKYIKEGGFVNAYPDALKNIDKAIELWPDESRFYLQKAWIIYAPNYCGDWLRAGVDDKLAVNAALPDIEQLFATAEKYDPNNAYINYHHALTLYRFTDPAQFDSIKDALLRELRAGNQKSRNFFFFPPPLLPYSQSARVAVLWGTETEAIFYDHWHQFGEYPVSAVRSLVDTMTTSLQWPEQKQEIAEVMYFAYAVGRTEPFDSSYFHMQQRVMDIIMEQQKDNAEERRKLAEEARYLFAQYRDTAQELYDRKLITDVKRLDVSGVEDVERSGSRKNNIKDIVQRRHAGYLKHFAETFDVQFPLPESPEEW
ncbi:hypothetical protein IT575_10535 [bacterium]|nr:hypothetical protein [bacterium]